MICTYLVEGATAAAIGEGGQEIMELQWLIAKLIVVLAYIVVGLIIQ